MIKLFRDAQSRGALTRRTLLALGVVVAFTVATREIGAEERLAELTAINVQARVIDAFDPREASKRRYGSLEFRGGLELTSPSKHFGGLSALRVAADGGRFLSLTDKGNWMRGRIVYEGDKPVRIADVEIAPMLGSDGKPLAARRWHDTESLAQDGDVAFVGIERANQIVRFDFGKQQGLLARGVPITPPAGLKNLPSNKGIEALEFVPKGLPNAGALIALSERGLDEIGDIQGFLIGGSNPGSFTVKRSDDFDITDAAILPTGELLILERHYSPMRGPAVRLRRIALGSIKPGAVVDGPVLIMADLAFQIDNMEGLSAHKNGRGETILTIVSDDNFSLLQRTLLLQFKLMD